MTTSAKPLIFVRVLKNSTYGICNAEPEGYYFDAGRQDYTYPHKVLTHFLACWGPAHKGDETAECVREIESYRIMSAKDILASGEPGMKDLFEAQVAVLPEDGQSPRIHVFRLGKKSPLSAEKRHFVGANRGYLELKDILGGD